MKKTVKRSLALFLAMVMLMSNVMTSMAAEPASGNGTATEETTAAQTEPTEVESDEIPDPQEEVPGDNTTSEEGETPSNDLTETPAGSKEEPTEAPEESPAPAESEPESSEESSEAVEEETTTAAETTAAETTEAASDEETTTAASEEETPAETEEAPKTVYAVSTYCDPEKGGKISISDSEVKEGEDLQFTVSVNEGYVLELVYVNDEEAEASNVNDTETVYHYVVEDVASDIDIEAHFAKAEEEETVEEAPSFTVLLDEAEIRIEEVEEGALSEVDHISVEALSQDEAIEEALLRQMKDGKDVADYAAFDITLYDENGEEVEPKGAVNVVISGVSTDAEYNEVGIYHVKEMQIQRPKFFAAPANNALPNAANSTADTEDTVSYYAEEVKSQVEDKIAENGEISFVVEHFSTYVITFIKDAEEFTPVEIHAVIENAGGEPIEIDLKDKDIKLSIENSININQLVSGYELAQIRDNDKLYVYKYATWGSNQDNIISDEEEITYDTIKVNASDGIYLWYEDVSQQMVPVSIDLDGTIKGSEEGGYSIPSGVKITYEEAQKAIASESGVWTYINTTIEPKSGIEGTAAEIDSVKRINGNYYVTLKDEAGEVPYLEEDWDVVLHFKKGRAINVHVINGTEDGTANSGNTVEGSPATRKYTRQDSEDVQIQIPITIAFGYRCVITDNTGKTIYDSGAAESYYRDRAYTLTEEQIGSATDITIAFSKINGTSLDYQHYVDNANKGVADSQYHGATLKVYNAKGELKKVLSNGQDDVPASLSISKGDYIEVTGINDTQYILNAIAINGETVTVPARPGEPDREPGWLWEETPSSEKENSIIRDNNNAVIADITVEAKNNYIAQLGFLSLYWEKKGFTEYTITFNEVYTNLVITDFNFVGTSHNEARFRTIGEGLSVSAILDGSTHIPTQNSGQTTLHEGEAVYGDSAEIIVTPEVGYYVKEIRYDDVGIGFTDSNPWYGEKRVQLTLSKDIHYIDIYSEPITFNFIYVKGENSPEEGKNTFKLTADSAFSGKFENIVPDSIPNQTFVGWSLTDDPAANYFVSNSLVGIHKDYFQKELDNGTLTIEYNNEGTASITLYPHYVDGADAEVASYKVQLYYNGDELYKELTESNGLAKRPIGSYIQRDTVLDVSCVSSAVAELTERGLSLDGEASDTIIPVDRNEEDNIFKLYYKNDEVKIEFYSKYGFEDILGNNVESLQMPGEKLVFSHTPKKSATDADGNNLVFAGWDTNDGKLPENVPGVETTYTAVYKLDANEDGEPDENQITIVFKIEQNEEGITFNATETGADGKEIILSDDGKTLTHWLTIGEDSYPPAPANDDLDIVPGTKKALSEWEPTYALIGSVNDDTYDKKEFVAQFKPDLNEDGIPDETQGFQTATLKPYDTSIYSGGAQEDGFPELALRYVEGTRQVDDSVIIAIVINGVRYEGAKTSDLFDAVYWQDGDVAARPDDTEGGIYNAAVVLKNEAKASVPGSIESSDDGMLTDADNHHILAANYPVVIEAKYDDGKEVIYKITVNPAELIVRYVNADDVYRPVAGSEAELVLEEGKAAAVVPDEAQLLVNGRSERPVDRTKADISLLSDEVLDLADNRKQLLIDKGYETIGVDGESAEAQGYKSITRYFDLVDYSNGNAWVSSSHPTDVYITYPEGTNSSTDFTFLHFKDLHRENYYGDVPSAIAGADVEEVTLELHDDYIKFSTKPGTEAFSPFMLIWKTETETGTDTPSTGGGTASNPTGSGDATPSGPVSVQQSGNSKGYYYTAGLHGNWVHMDNVDMNVPLDEPVPAGATAVDFPEWHRWRFYLSSGVMLDNQWAHIENPYAVGEQPRSGWFYFDHDGLMRYGWYLDTRSGDWYYMHSESDGMLGTMMTGWHYDSHDNRWYYLDPQSGAMKTGWQQIGGKWYYFNPTPFGETWTLDHSTSVWRFNGNTVRPYGSMYQNEVTPDGYKVGEDGAWIQ